MAGLVAVDLHAGDIQAPVEAGGGRCGLNRSPGHPIVSFWACGPHFGRDSVVGLLEAGDMKEIQPARPVRQVHRFGKCCNRATCKNVVGFRKCAAGTPYQQDDEQQQRRGPPRSSCRVTCLAAMLRQRCPPLPYESRHIKGCFRALLSEAPGRRYRRPPQMFFPGGCDPH